LGAIAARAVAPSGRQHGDLHRHLGGLLGHGLDLVDEHRAVGAERCREHHLHLGLVRREDDLADEVQIDDRQPDLGIEDGLKRVEDLLLLLGLGDDRRRRLLRLRRGLFCGHVGPF
jgi:hypothetical protein